MSSFNDSGVCISIYESSLTHDWDFDAVHSGEECADLLKGRGFILECEFYKTVINMWFLTLEGEYVLWCKHSQITSPAKSQMIRDFLSTLFDGPYNVGRIWENLKSERDLVVFALQKHQDSELSGINWRAYVVDPFREHLVAIPYRRLDDRLVLGIPLKEAMESFLKESILPSMLYLEELQAREKRSAAERERKIFVEQKQRESEVLSQWGIS